MIRVRGVLRNMLTQPVPKPRSTGTGETRIAASNTPSTNAPTTEASVSLRIHRNPVTYTSTLAGSEKTFIALLYETRGYEMRGYERRGRRPVKAAGPAPTQPQLVSLLA